MNNSQRNEQKRNMDMCLGMPTKPLRLKNNRAADTVKPHWCVHQGKVTTTFYTVMLTLVDKL